ncbi:MAG TPA: hypothetical protein VGP64_05375 [Polyangia bacterium]
MVLDADIPSTDIPSGAALGALARKYARLSAWRDRRDAAAFPATRDELRALAAEFPGCLRELDTLGAAELGRRASACAAAAADAAAAEPWMSWIDGYHALVRRALAAREARARGTPPADDTFERAILAPPGGRMGVVIMRALAQRFGLPASTIAAALFPVRRPSPYDL